MPLLQLWLRAQVERVDKLEITVDSSDGQLLQGNIPYATVTATQVCYQGLEADYVHLQAQAIHLNLPQMLKGESLRLLDPIVVHLCARATRAQLRQALQSPLVVSYGINPAGTDGEIQAMLTELLQSLGVTIDRLEIDAGGIWCQVRLPVRAT